MMFLKAITFLLAATVAVALRTNDTSICDYYTTLALKDNTAENQQKLMQIITHTFILGNYTTPNVGVKVAGVATPAMWDGEEVNLLSYFDGGYASTNLGGSHGVVKNFLDDGGATALLQNKSSLTSNSSNQYNLLTHVYQYFGEFYGCSLQGGDEFPGYKGRPSMFTVHRFMDSNKAEMGYFIEQIVLAVQSVGFEDADATYTREALDKTFNFRCSPAATVIPPAAGPQLQAICIAEDCPLDLNQTCSAYPNDGVASEPTVANNSLVNNSTKASSIESSGAANSTASGSSTASSTTAASTGGAVKLLGSFGAVAGAVLLAIAL